MNNKPVSKKKLYLAVIIAFIAGLLVMLLTLQLVIPAITAPKVSEAGSVPAEIMPYTPEWFAYDRTYGKKNACIDILFSENPVTPIAHDDFPDGYGWFYSIYLSEINGFDFEIESYKEYFFSDGSVASDFTYTADDMIIWWGASKVGANEQNIVRGGMPLQNLSGLAIEINGKDSRGKALSFYGYLEFTQEISE